MRLTAINRVAIDAGLLVGANLADARALVPDLVVRNHDVLADGELLERIADACLRYTPMVAVEAPDGLMLDITGSTHLVGGGSELERCVRDWLNTKQIEVRLARGSSAEAARALARFHRGTITDEQAAIRALPVAALQLDQEADLDLRRAGLKTIGDVMDRPRKVIAARFGTESVYRLERLIGASSKPIDPRPPALSRIFCRRFAEPVASQNYALIILHELLEEANLALAEEDMGGRAFEARFCRVDGLVRRLYVETGLPTRDSAAVIRLFDERLDGLSDPLDPGFGFDSIELEIMRTELLKPSQDDFERETDSRNPLAETLDVLTTRLGHNRLLRFRPNDTYIPENGQVPLSVIAATQPFSWRRPQAEEPPARPLRLFDPPERITVIAEIPDGPPRRFQWRRKLREVTRYEGPERIAPEWWKGTTDPLGRDQLTRDYYRVEDIDGRRYWVFRNGLYGRETGAPDWYLHGLFA